MLTMSPGSREPGPPRCWEPSREPSRPVADSTAEGALRPRRPSLVQQPLRALVRYVSVGFEPAVRPRCRRSQAPRPHARLAGSRLSEQPLPQQAPPLPHSTPSLPALLDVGSYPYQRHERYCLAVPLRDEAMPMTHLLAPEHLLGRMAGPKRRAAFRLRARTRSLRSMRVPQPAKTATAPRSPARRPPQRQRPIERVRWPLTEPVGGGRPSLAARPALGARICAAHQGGFEWPRTRARA
jgi:hypothetical protein